MFFTPVVPFMGGGWWLSGSAVDLKFTTGQYRDSSILGTDPNAASTVLMLHGDGADGSTNISDSTGRHFVTQVDNAQIDTAQSKFGGASILFDGSQDRLKLLDGSSDFVFGTGDFTIDMWVRTSATSAFQFLYSAVPTGDVTSLVYLDLYINAADNKVIYRRGAGDSAQITSTTALAINTWYHVALTRSSGSTRLFINGTQEGGTFTDTTNFANPAARPFIGADGYSEAFLMIGWLDEYRVLKGVAAWTANFTPPSAAYDVGIGPYDELSCSRASIGYSRNAAGTLTQFAANQLRITDLGLLVEDARTNLILQSQTFGTTWTQDGVSVTSDATTAPDGTTTADKIVESAANAEHRVYQNPGSGSDVGVWSVYAKAAGRSWISLSQGAGSHYVFFDLTNGVVGSSGGDFTNITIEALANGWYRCSAYKTSATSFFVIALQSSDVGSSFNTGYLGNGTSGVYLWGAQFEVSTFVSSYIPTTSAAATRAKDNVTCIGALSTVLDGTATSVVMDEKMTAQTAAVFLGDGNYQHGYIGSQPFSFNDTSIFVKDDGNPSLNGTLGTGTWTTGAKGAFARDGSGRSMVGGGGTVLTDSNVPITFSPKMFSGGTTPDLLFGYTRRLTAWNTRLADATLQSFTNP
jgi:hypothetical protein